MNYKGGTSHKEVNKMDSKWDEIRNLCLELALAELKKETAPTAATVGTVRELVKIAIEIDMLNLQRSVQSRYGAAVFRDRP